MSLRKLPAIKNFQKPEGLETFAPVSAFARWNSALAFSGETSGTTIDILDVIGRDPWTGDGVTAEYVLGKLRDAEGDVTVNINSPGGDYFEGGAIYELLRGYDGKVIVNVLSLAASAASIVMVAGDEIRMGRTAFVMIHNCWGICIGDRHDMTQCADVQGQIDSSIAGVYAERTKLDEADLSKMMDTETWLGVKLAIEQGFADAALEPGDISASLRAPTQAKALNAKRQMDSILATHGMTRDRRRSAYNEIKRDTQDAAAQEGMQDAAKISGLATELRALHATLIHRG